MPRKAKAQAPSIRVRKSGASKGANKLTLKTPLMDLTLETSDSSFIAGILEQLEVTAAEGVKSVGRPKGKRGPKPAKAAPAASKGSILTKADLAKAMKTANPSNHEQRILLVGLLVSQKGGEVFTTEDIKAAAAEVGISGSTIPGSISKLKSAKLIAAKRDGRRAFYTLTATGEAAAKKILEGTAPTSRRGRKAGAKKKVAKKAASKKTAAKKSAVKKSPAKRGRKPGPKPAAKRGRKPGIKAGTKRPAINKDGSPRKKPGPKPSAGAKKVAKKAAAKKTVKKAAAKKAVAKKKAPAKKTAFAKAAAKKAAAPKTSSES